MSAPVVFDETCALLNRIAYIHQLCGELAPLAVSPSSRSINRITDQQQVAIFDLLHAIDDLLPGGTPVARAW